MTLKKRQTDLLWLAERIVEAYNEHGFVSAVIFGKQGTGKTTYAFKVARDVFYKLYNLDTKDEAWEYVKKHYFFELPEALDKLEDAVNNDYRIPLLIFDDAGIWLSKYEWNADYMKVFYKIYALIRTRVSAVIFTTPSPDDISKYLREKGWYQIKIVWANKKDRIAEAQLYKKVFAVSKSGNIVAKAKHKAVDQFKVEVPNDFYNEYLQKRKETEKRLVEELRSILAKYRAKQTVEIG